MKTTTKRKAQNTGPLITFFKFNSIHELIKKMYKDEPTATGTKKSFNRSTENSQEVEWTGGLKGFNEYFDLLKNGYLPAVEELSNETTGEGTRQLLTPSVYGEFSDVGAFLAGHPECMGTFEEQPTENTIKINISTCTPTKMPGSELMEKCKTIFNCVNHLETNGKRVEIYISTAAGEKRRNHIRQAEIKIKSIDEPLLAAYHGLLLGHLATTRILIYGFLSLYSPDETLGRVEITTISEMINIDLWHDSKNSIQSKLLTQGSGTL